MAELTVIIPARNEMWTRNTVEDILANMRGDTEIIVVADGQWINPPLDQHEKVHIIYHPTPVGQRAATNEGARVATSDFIMKADAHCAFDEGFDVKLLAPYKAGEIGRDVTTVPRMYNLHVFDWVCKGCSHRIYQGPTPTECPKCKAPQMVRELVWKPRRSRKSDFMRFDNTLHFRYWGEYGRRPEAQGEIADQMCCVGACWLLRRDRYFELGGMDEEHGSWGQMGVELACKSWLSGGRQVVNTRTWFAHLFRTQGGDFGFPYPLPGRDVDRARAHSRRLWAEGKWAGAKYPLSWLIARFAPVPDWPGDAAMPTESSPVVASGPEVPEPVAERVGLSENLIVAPPAPPALPTIQISPRRQPASAGMVYYSDCRPDPALLDLVRRQIRHASGGLPLVEVSLAPLPILGDPLYQQIQLARERGILTMFMQILGGLEALNTEVAFLVEHDVLYHPCHFEFRPPTDTAYYYNEHAYRLDWQTGQALFYFCKQTSGLCANRQLLVEHYRKRIAKVQSNAEAIRAQGQPVRKDGFSQHMGFEPGCHMYPRGVDNFPAVRWMADYPNLDIRHDRNLTPSRWQPDLFRNQGACLGWTMADTVPGWGQTKGRMPDFLAEVRRGCGQME